MKQITIQKGHSPTLNTILMVESLLQNMTESIITVAEIKRQLPKKINHNTLLTILDYLQKDRKIFISTKGITWLTPMNPELKEAISNGLQI